MMMIKAGGNEEEEEEQEEEEEEEEEVTLLSFPPLLGLGGGKEVERERERYMWSIKLLSTQRERELEMLRQRRNHKGSDGGRGEDERGSSYPLPPDDLESWRYSNFGKRWWWWWGGGHKRGREGGWVPSFLPLLSCSDTSTRSGVGTCETFRRALNSPGVGENEDERILPFSCHKCRRLRRRRRGGKKEGFFSALSQIISQLSHPFIPVIVVLHPALEVKKNPFFKPSLLPYAVLVSVASFSGRCFKSSLGKKMLAIFDQILEKEMLRKKLQ